MADEKDNNKETTEDKEEEDQKDQESSNDEEQIGLLDKPVVVEGKRERKSISRLSLESPKPSTPKADEFDYSKGKGVKLGEIERVKYEINRSSADELKPLHKLLYNRDGKQFEVKKNIRNFCGFPFEKDSKYHNNKEERLERFTLTGLKRLCELFALETKGKREDLKERVMTFLMEPYNSGKPVPAAKSKTSKKKKKPSGTSNKKKPSKPKKASNSIVDSDDDSDSDIDEEDEEKKPVEEEEEKEDVKEEEEQADAEEEDQEEEEEEEKEEIKKPSKKEKKPKEQKKVAKKSQEKSEKKQVPKAEKSPKPKAPSKAESKGKEKKKKATPVRIEKKEKNESKKKEASTPSKTPQKKEGKKKRKISEDSSEDSDDVPIAKKVKSTKPTDTQLAKCVKKILDGADLEAITMKTVCKQVYDQFPDHDLTDKKNFIKETVKKIIS